VLLLLSLLVGIYGLCVDHLNMLRTALDAEVNSRMAGFMNQIQCSEALMENCPLAIASLSTEQQILAINASFERMFGYSQTEVLGKKLGDLGLIDGGLATAKIQEHGTDWESDAYRLGQCRTKSGTIMDVEVYGVPIFQNDRMTGAYAIYLDISERLSAEVALQETLQREMRLVEITQIINSALDLSSILQRVTNLSCNLVGADAGMIGLIDQDAREIRFPYLDNLPESFAQPAPEDEGMAWQMVIKGEGVLIANYDRHPQAQQDWIDAGVKAILGTPLLTGSKCIGAICLYRLKSNQPFTDRDLGFIEVIGSQAGVAIEKANLFDEIRRLANTDDLTGVFNRRHFDTCVSLEFERALRYGRPMGLLIVDPDHFKNINDEHGHQAGDMVLKEVARRLKSNVRRSDIVARYGGDEFVIILPEINREGSIIVAEKIRALVRDKPVQIGDHSIGMKVSIGVAALPDTETETPDQLLKMADDALYEAKRSGRDRVCSADGQS
jgi:diguanylate cyclase (GGDEF)-like protein/PAS domain S-box-containing protein